MHTYYPASQLCDGMDDLQGFQNCIEENTNSFVDSNKPAAITPFIFSQTIGWKVLPSNGSIGFNETTSMQLIYKQYTEYYLFIFASNFAFPTVNPSVSPKTFVKIHDTDHSIIIFLKVFICEKFDFNNVQA